MNSIILKKTFIELPSTLQIMSHNTRALWGFLVFLDIQSTKDCFLYVDKSW